MKKTNIITTLALCAGFCALAQEAPTTNTMAGTRQNSLSPMNRSMDDMTGRFGAGITLGEPIGASVKYWFNDTMAVDGALGWSYRDHTDLYLHSDILWHDFNLLPVSQGRLPLYFGVGALLRFRDDDYANQAGIRAPVGVSYMFDNVPVDIFAEVAPAIDIAPFARGEVTGGIGVRYWF